MTAFKDHFSDGAAGYAAHRPTYPPALVDFLASVAPATGLALDCGCGTGQLSVLLARRFARVVAIDASAPQIAQARPQARVTYRCAPVERSGLAEGSADLITAAQAAHWFDLPAFYAEARRVARPGAVIALIAYGTLTVADPAVHDAVMRFYHGKLRPHWPAERRQVEDGYRALPFPFAELAAPALAIEVEWERSDLLGYVATWSAVRALAKAEGEAGFAAFGAELDRLWRPEGGRKRIRLPLALRAGRIGDGGR